MERLRHALRERNEFLFKDVEHQVEKATPQLWHSYGTFPSGTKHTPEHTQMVEKIAGWLLPDTLDISEMAIELYDPFVERLAALDPAIPFPLYRQESDVDRFDKMRRGWIAAGIGFDFVGVFGHLYQSTRPKLLRLA